MTARLDFPRPCQPVFQHLAAEEMPFGLSGEQVRSYSCKGFLILRQVLDVGDIEELRRESDRLLADADLSGRNLRYAGPFAEGVTVPWKIDPCVDISPLFAKLARDRRICDPLRSIYGGFAPRLFKDKLIIKPAKAHGNGLHQDYNWWQGFPGSLLSVSIPLDETTRENGCTELWTGWQEGFRHEAGSLDGQIDPESLAGEEHIHAELKPGDIAIFHCLAPHAAGPNTSDNPRRALFLSYNDSRDGEHRQSHYDHFFAYAARNLTLDQRQQLYW